MKWCRKWLFYAGVTLVALAATASDSLPHAAYIWQRNWNSDVTNAMAAASYLDGFVVLAAETGPSRTFRTAYNTAALLASGKTIGLALRINAGAAMADVPALAASLVGAACSNGLSVAELQLDYDCPESKLLQYREMAQEVRRRLTSTPVTITALPTWLRQPSFSNLVAATDGFVLQVHSLDAQLRLCDTGAARRAVERASRFGVPFRVALPTYGHLVATDRDGKVLGVASEATPPSWPPDALLHEVRSAPSEIALLTRAWNDQRPTHLEGFIWYRLPVGGDRLNWSGTTLAAVVAGRVPRPNLSLQLHQPRPGLVEVSIANVGEADAYSPVSVRVTWRDAALLASDALAGFAVAPAARNDVNSLVLTGISRLAPAESRVVGWLRFKENRNVQCEACLD